MRRTEALGSKGIVVKRSETHRAASGEMPTSKAPPSKASPVVVLGRPAGVHEALGSVGVAVTGSSSDGAAAETSTAARAEDNAL